MSEKQSERLADLYKRNERLERELNKISHYFTLKDKPRKNALLTELQSVIDEIEKLEKANEREQ